MHYYSIVNISRINIDDPCKCDSIIDLTDEQSTINTRFTSAITKEDLRIILENETYCHYPEAHEKWRWVHPHEFCQFNKDKFKQQRQIGMQNF